MAFLAFGCTLLLYIVLVHYCCVLLLYIAHWYCTLALYIVVIQCSWTMLLCIVVVHCRLLYIVCYCTQIVLFVSLILTLAKILSDVCNWVIPTIISLFCLIYFFNPTGMYLFMIVTYFNLSSDSSQLSKAIGSKYHATTLGFWP